MTQPAKSQEPSMEEILASIRRIIADDDANKSPQRPAEALQAPAPDPAPRVAPPEPSLAEAEPAMPKPADADPIGGHMAAKVGGEAVEDQPSDILDLTESMASPMPEVPPPEPAPQFRTIDGSFDVSYEEPPERPAMQSNIGEAHPSFAGNGSDHRGGERPRLISSETSAAVDSAFNTLAHTVLVQNARTLEDLVKEMLRPMLKTWLDDNLPGMVERLVRAEIERVSRGRMG